MTRNLLCILSALAVLACLAACGRGAEDTPPATTPPESTAAPTEAAETARGFSDGIYSFQVQLNGVGYTLPAPFWEFAANGWTIKDKGELAPERNSPVIIAENGQAQVSLCLVNMGADSLPYAQCQVGSISVDQSQAGTGASLVLSQGITIGSDYATALAAYGEPTDTYEPGDHRQASYSLGAHVRVEISSDTTTGKISDIKVELMAAREYMAADSLAPQALRDYEPPAALGGSWEDFTFKLDGELYALPAPVMAFLANGWVCDGDENAPLAAKSGRAGFELRKDGQTLRAMVRNYDDAAQPTKFCFVSSLRCSEPKLALPKGISEQSNLKDLTAAYGPPDKTEDSASFIYHTYGKVSASVRFTFHKKDKAIHTIEIDRSPRELD